MLLSVLKSVNTGKVEVSFVGCTVCHDRGCMRPQTGRWFKGLLLLPGLAEYASRSEMLLRALVGALVEASVGVIVGVFVGAFVGKSRW